jgi:hypothetical protein
MREQDTVRRAASTVLATSARRPRAWRLDVVKDLLTDLQTATFGGRRFTIEKVVKILEEETAAAAPDLSELQRRGLAKALADLRNEQRRPSPRVEAFAIRVETMLWTFASV